MPQTAPVKLKIRPYQYLATLQILDVLTTGFILEAWTERAEGNPIVGYLLHMVGLYPGLAILLVAKLAVVYMFYLCQTGVRFASVIYNLVLINNLLFILIWFWN